MNRARVLLITPFPPKKDGLASYGRDLAGALDEVADVEVITQKSGARRNHVSPLLSANPLTVRRLALSIRTHRPEIVHVQFTVPAYGLQVLWLLLGVAIGRSRSECRVVWTLHEVIREIALLRGVGRLLYRAIARTANALIVLSEESATCLVSRCGVPPERVHVLPHGVFGGHRRLDPSAPRDGPIVYFGYLHPDKGVQHLVAARSHMREEADVVIVGSVRPRQGVFRLFERRDYRYAAGLRGMERGEATGVVFSGYLADDDLDSLLHTATAAVFPYLAVTQSGAVNRAITMGCPIVASDLPGLRADAPATAVLVPPGDPAALAAALDRLVGDAELVARMSAATRAHAVSRSGTEIARRHQAVYRTLATDREG